MMHVDDDIGRPSRRVVQRPLGYTMMDTLQAWSWLALVEIVQRPVAYSETRVPSALLGQ